MLKARMFMAIIFVLVISFSIFAADGQQTLTGIVSDDMCGADHSMMPGKTSSECTRICVKDGDKYVLVVDKQVYVLEGHAVELEKLAGSKATVTGAVKGTTVQVSSVAAAK